MSPTVTGQGLSEACPQELNPGHGRRGLSHRGEGVTPLLGWGGVGSPAASCSSQSSCCHPRWSGQRKRFRCEERKREDGLGWTRLGWSLQPPGAQQGWGPSPEPAVGQVPGELCDRNPVVAVREAEEGDGLEETLLLLLLALEQVLALEGGEAKSQGEGGSLSSPGMGGVQWDQGCPQATPGSG